MNATSPSLSPVLELLRRAPADHVALVTAGPAPVEVTFGELVARSEQVTRALVARYAPASRDAREPLAGLRFALLASPEPAWLAALFGVLAGGGVAVPLSPMYPAREIAWFLSHCGATACFATEAERGRVESEAEGSACDVIPLGNLELVGDPRDAARSSEPAPSGIVLYTSGTTGRPKAALIAQDAVATQMRLVAEAWSVGPRDRLLHALPLHHLHGLGISLLTTLGAGASARLVPRFDAAAVFEALAAGDVTVWMAVPTMYQKLVEAFEAADAPTRARWSAGARGLRLCTSGSAALPVSLAQAWRAIAGEIPLERFGMTEIGVGATNPLEPEGRREGTVGFALPSVECRVRTDDGELAHAGQGELHVRGPSLFWGYLGDPAATRAAFDGDWFVTGDRCSRADDGRITLLGRTSVDILKSGGYKISALEIEEALREHAAVAEVAVVGLPDATWGDRIVAVVVARGAASREGLADALRAFARERLPAYKIPREVRVVDALPRNALGKVVKPELAKQLAAASSETGPS